MGKQRTYETIPALVHAYVECPHCGRIPRPTGTLLVLAGSDSPDRAHCNVTCDRCGDTRAMLYLERELMSPLRH